MSIDNIGSDLESLILNFSLDDDFNSLTCFSHFLDELPLSIFALSSDGSICYKNNSASNLMDTVNIDPSSNVLALLDESDSNIIDLFYQYFAIGNKDLFKTPFEISLYDGENNHYSMLIECIDPKNIFNKIEDSHFIFCSLTDKTQLYEKEQKLLYYASYDSLTGLGNRDKLHRDLDKLLKEKERSSEGQSSLFYINLDRFKVINERLGHRYGNDVIFEVSNRFKDLLRETDSVYRLQGDEFVVLLPCVKRYEDLMHVANKILETITAPYKVLIESPKEPKVKDVSIGASIGITLIPQDGEDRHELLKHADTAMYEAKRKDNHIVFFDKKLDLNVKRRVWIEDGLRSAIENNSFDLYYQPLVDSSSKIQGMEALIRWFGKDGTFVPPSVFIPIAEEADLIDPLTYWVMKSAATYIKEVHKRGYERLYVSVNVSGHSLSSGRLYSMVNSIFENEDISPSAMKLELTESVFIKNHEFAIQQLTALKEKYPELKIAIDDFGTGYSSFQYLSDFPADVWKLDQSFISKIGIDKKGEQIVDGMVSLAKSINMDVIAEGVEEKSQFDYLSGTNCLIQGYYFSKAVPPEDLFEFIGAHY